MRAIVEKSAGEKIIIGRVGVVLLVLLWTSSVQAKTRVGLLIANQNYTGNVGALATPFHDAEVVGAALKQVGFELGQTVKDASREQMLEAVHDFAGRLKAAGPKSVGFLYYSGHGIAAANDNVLLPVGIHGTNPRELEIFGVKLAEVIDILNDSAPDAIHFLAIDAARSNLAGSRGVKGFIPMAERPGMLLSLSTSPGIPARVQDGDTSPYAAALASEIVVPGHNHGEVFFQVRRRVAAATRQAQIPWTRDGLLQRVYFGGAAPTGPQAPEAHPAAPSLLVEAGQAWALAKDSKDKGVLEAFIKRYHDTFYAELARARIKELEPSGHSTTTSAPAVVPAPQVSKPATSRKRQVQAPCRKETHAECVARVCPTGRCGLRGSGICSDARRHMVCR